MKERSLCSGATRKKHCNNRKVPVANGPEREAMFPRSKDLAERRRTTPALLGGLCHRPPKDRRGGRTRIAAAFWATVAASVLATLVFTGTALGAQTVECDCWQRVRAPTFLGDYPIDQPGSAAAFDSARGRLVKFGGSTFVFGAIDQTWEWDGTQWIALNPPTKPPARTYAAMGYDPIRKKIVMFGGMDQNNIFTPFMYDTWEWDGNNWVMPPQANPPSLGGTATQSPYAPDFSPYAGFWTGRLVWDPINEELVLVGGLALDMSLFTGVGAQETWVYKNGTWIKKNPPTKLPPRIAPAVAADPARGQIVAFGGAEPSFWFQDNSYPPEMKALKDELSVLSDTWSWDGNTWKKLNPKDSPPPRLHGAMSDGFNDTPPILFGGQSVTAIDADGNGLKETINGTWGDAWAFVGDTWVQLVIPESQTDKDRKGPGARNEHFVVYNTQRREVVVAGGYVLGIPEETTATWTWSPPFGRPYSLRQYFAEGFTGNAASPFDEWITLFNNSSSEAKVKLRYAKSDGSWVDQGPITVPPTSRGTVNVTAFLGPGVEHSTYVFSDNLSLYSERPMYFNYLGTRSGGHDGVGASMLSRTFYFAEGFTGPGFDTYFTVFNPNWWPVNVQFTYFLPGGGTKVHNAVVGARSRQTFNARDVVGSSEFSTRVVAGSGLIHVEQPIYFDYGGIRGGSVNSGQTELSPTANFAEGFTGSGFDEYLTVGNPNPSAVQIRIVFMRETGGPVVVTDTMPPNSRRTYKANDYLPAGTAHGTRIEASKPIMAARPMYFSYGPGWKGGDVGVGFSASQWALFAEGFANSARSHPYITIANPNPVAANVQVLFLFPPPDFPMLQNVTVPANGRATVNVLSLFDNKEFSVFVLSPDPTKPVLVERPQYFNYRGWDGGSVSAGYNGSPPP
jgi:hypothetical protein